MKVQQVVYGLSKAKACECDICKEWVEPLVIINAKNEINYGHRKNLI